MMLLQGKRQKEKKSMLKNKERLGWLHNLNVENEQWGKTAGVLLEKPPLSRQRLGRKQPFARICSSCLGHCVRT